MARANLKARSDVYVSFAFAGADLLLEITPAHAIAFIVGAALPLTGRPARVLEGTPLLDLFGPGERERVAGALGRMDGGGRLRNFLVSLLHPEGQPVQVVLSGFRAPDGERHYYVAVSHSPPVPAAAARHPGSGLLDKGSFEAAAHRLLHEAPPAEPPYRLTLLSIPGLDELRQRAGAEGGESFLADVGGFLRSCSVGGDAAGVLGDGRFGVIHAAQVTEAEIGARIAELARAADPTGAGAAPRTASVAMDLRDISAEEAASALLYTINRFSAQKGGFTLDGLADGCRPLLSRTVKDMAAFKATVERGDFRLVYQPVVDMWTNVIHHFECLVRFGADDRSPYDVVCFAEDTGLIGTLDLAVVGRAVEALQSGSLRHPALRCAVNLSGRSLSSPAWVKRLRALLASVPHLSGRLLFELTESAEIKDLAAVNAVVQDIRRMGFRVCLDDFGAGSAAFHYLRALRVDHVKIDGGFVRDAMTSGESIPFLKAIVRLCHDLRITTIAEYVTNEEAANLLRLLKVRYGQGWLFGKAVEPRSDTSDMRAQWVFDNTVWRRHLLHWKNPGKPAGRG